MISYLINVVAILSIAMIIFYIGLTIMGVIAMNEERLRHKLYLSNSLDNTPEEVGVSIIVCELLELSKIEELLSLDYFNYEVILVIDMNQNAESSSLLSHYSMVEMALPSSFELGGFTLSHIYRSRQSRYHRLIIADHIFHTVSATYNCGVCLSSHNYILSINRWITLNSDALQRIATEIMLNTKEVYAIGALCCSKASKSTVNSIDYISQLVVNGAGIGTLTGCALPPNTIIAFNYNAIVEAGGYSNNFTPSAELLKRVDALADQDLLIGESLFCPQIIAQLDYTESPYHLNSMRWSRVIIYLSIMMLALSLLTMQPENITTVVAIWISYYVAAISIALISLISYHKTQQIQSSNMIISRVILSILRYPLFLLLVVISKPSTHYSSS